MSAGEPLVAIEGAARTFGDGAGAVVAVLDVSCRVYPGDRIALTGPSGSGKTTLLHLLAGLDEPTVGRVSWPAMGRRAELRPGPVAVVFQAPSLIPALDVAENTELPLLLRNVEPDRARRRAHDALATLGLAELAAKLPEELSGGQAQRVAVARILADEPRLILADEPTGQLDAETGQAVMDALLRAAQLTGAGLVVNTHDQRMAERLPQQWAMRDGRLDTDPTIIRAQTAASAADADERLLATLRERVRARRTDSDEHRETQGTPQ